MREFQINKNDSDQRVDKFLMKTLPALPKSLMYKAIRNKKIKVNRKRCEISQRLQEGDTMQLFLAEEFFVKEADWGFLNADTTLDILYQDEHLLIVNKPAGLVTHGTPSQDNLMDRIKHYLYQKKEYFPDSESSFAPALCHRIDRNTQGIVIAAKDAMSLRLINEKIRDRKLDKYYICITEGHMPKKQGMITLYHTKDEAKNQALISDQEKPGYKLMQTGYRVLETGNAHDLLEVKLYSGRSHQIRATMAHIGHPLLSDIKYGARSTAFPYQALCAYKVRFHFEEHEELYYLNEKEIQLPHIYLQKYFQQKKL